MVSTFSRFSTMFALTKSCKPAAAPLATYTGKSVARQALNIAVYVVARSDTVAIAKNSPKTARGKYGNALGCPKARVSWSRPRFFHRLRLTQLLVLRTIGGRNADIQYLGSDHITGADTVRIRGKTAAYNTKSFMVIYYTIVLYCSQSAI